MVLNLWIHWYSMCSQQSVVSSLECDDCPQCCPTGVRSYLPCTTLRLYSSCVLPDARWPDCFKAILNQALSYLMWDGQAVSCMAFAGEESQFIATFQVGQSDKPSHSQNLPIITPLNLQTCKQILGVIMKNIYKKLPEHT